MDEHRVALLGGAWRRQRDPLHSADPRVREVIGALAGLPVAPDPRPEFRAELRAQLVAVTPRLVAEGELTAPAVAPAPEGRAEAPAARRRLHIAKPLIAAACVLTAFVLLLGGAVLISQHALPGDALYGLKRASENTEYSLAGGAVDRGKLKLEFAARRIGEVGDLLPRASSMAAGTGAVADGGAINSDTAHLIRETLDSADGDVKTAARQLNGAAVANTDHAPLNAMTSWTPGQISAMRTIVARIPAGPLHHRAGRTLALLHRAQQRAEQLGAQLGCSCLDPDNADELGPVPCTGPCTAATPGHRHPHKQPATKRSRTGHGHPAGRSSGHPSGRSAGPRGTASTGGTAAPSRPKPARTRQGSAPPVPPGSSSAPTSAPPAPPVTVTTPVVPLPSIPGLFGGSSSGSGGSGSGIPLPISVSSSCATVSVGPIGVGVGNC